MNPLDYFGNFISAHKKAENVCFVDERTGDVLETRSEVNEHCKEQAENFEDEEAIQ